eukprot:CAMPEP_0169092502 /NCGR_PEP_ID=MMETSP1015-20121227/16937_1 /TAXON_ID=342587 /ORGANISM="Karlodinium micrum, Strain CCMP2283" /LENGTH=91 /DNA_ID=CAMNT_0009153079 /DNA_START=54 /DNA_END=329 /DNA_ORIENTATION=-
MAELLHSAPMEKKCCAPSLLRYRDLHPQLALRMKAKLSEEMLCAIVLAAVAKSVRECNEALVAVHGETACKVLRHAARVFVAFHESPFANM